MKTYLITFKNKKTGDFVTEVKMEVDNDTHISSLVFLALDELKTKGTPLPLPKAQKCDWSYQEAKWSLFWGDKVKKKIKNMFKKSARQELKKNIPVD